jgi:DNA-binding SARP family transcriptional activator
MDQALAADSPRAALALLLRDAAPAAFAQHLPAKILAWAETISGLEPGDHVQLLYYALKAASLMGKVNQTIAIYDRIAGLRSRLSPQQDVETRTIASRSLSSVDPQRAMALIDEGLAIYPADDPGCGNIRTALLLHKYFLLEEAHQYQQAIAMSSELLALDPADDNMAYRVNNTLGMIYLRQGQWDAADQLFRDVVIPAARRSSESELGQTLENRGAVLARLCRFAEAGEHFAQALAIAEQQLRSDRVASILNARANVSLRQGQHKKALAEKEQAARIAYTLGNQALLASCLNDIAGIRMELGEQAGVIELLQRSLRLKQAAGNRAGSATTMNNLAECYLRGSGAPADHSLALEWAQRANQLLVELGYNANLVDNIVTMSQASLGLGNHGRALEYAEQAVAAAGKLNTPYNRATALAQKGTVLLALGSDDAAPVLQEAAALFAEIGNRPEQARALTALAGYYHARSIAAQAGELALRAAEIYRELKLEKPLAELIDRYPEVFTAKTAHRAAGPAAHPGGMRIQTLGPFRVTPAGGSQPLADTQWGSQLGRLMLAYLVTADYGARQGVDRQRILQIFWNDSGAGGSMRVLLHRLRKCLDCREAVLFADNKYSFNWRLAGVWFDREQMEARYRQGSELAAGKKLAEAWDQLEQAEGLFRGQYLEGIDEQWVAKTRKALAETHRDILDKLIELSRQLGRDQAAAFYRQKLSQ